MFIGSVSFEICRQGEAWICLLRRARTSTLVLLLGAGGAVLYYYLAKTRLAAVNRSSSSPTSPRRRRRRDGHNGDGGGRRFSSRPRGLWHWLFAEELVEDLTEDGYFLHSHYFGPAASSTLRGEEGAGGGGGEVDEDELLLQGEYDEDREDCSLNCLSNESSPKESCRLSRYRYRTTI